MNLQCLSGCRLLSLALAAPILVASSATGASLSWTQHEGYREAALSVPQSGRTGFTLLRPEQSGVFFTNQLSYARAEANQNLMNGCGVAAGDFDGDGNCDLYFANSEGPNGLFRNTGQWRFEDATALAGVQASNQSTKGVVFADVNGDGMLDLFAASLGGPNALFLNLGGGRFTNVTASAGLLAKAGAHSAAFADVDGDGDLDLYVANYGEVSILRSGGQFSVRKVNGKDTVTGRWARRLKIIEGGLIELGEPDVLYLNDGKGRFSAVPWTGGAFLREDGTPLKTEPWDMGLSVLFHDLNGDRAPDIYVCNDFQTPDRIWINDGRGHFRALPDLALRVTPHFSMGIDFADIDRDGHDDFFIGDMLSPRHALRMTQMGETNPPPAHVGETMDRQQIRRNMFAWNRGDGTYADIAEFAGIAASDWTWSVAFLDVDLDGYEDLLAVTAHAYDTQDFDTIEKSPTAVGLGQNRQIGKSLKDFPPLITPNYLFRNRGNRTFEEVGARWGFNSTNICHGIALADLDNDGDLDIAVSCLWQPPLLYRNETTAPRVAVRLRGLPPNTKGIGARVTLKGGAVPVQSQEIHCGGRYLSADDTMRTFAAGSHSNDMILEVAWRGGKTSVVRGVEANHIYEVDETGAKEVPRSGFRVPGSIPPVDNSELGTRNSKPLFADVSASLAHTHEQTPFNDLERQPMLIRNLSRLGPGVAWWDLDGDGDDDLVVGASQGGRAAVFRNDGKGGMTRWNGAALDALLNGDLGGFAVLGGELVAGLSNYRGGSAAGLLLLKFNSSSLAWSPLAGTAPVNSSIGPVASGDIDGDGDLDVFVGGRVIPGRYPAAASSLLLRNDQGKLVPDAAASAAFKNLGLVSAAVFSDLDGDGLPELILACEWGPLKIFRNKGGTFTPWDAPTTLNSQLSTLSQLSGWWTSVTTGDFDGDGRLDIAAGNWGLNHSHAAPTRQPARLYFGDFDDNGSFNLIEAETDPENGRIVPKRDLVFLSRGMPVLRARFPKHALFAAADMSTALGASYANAGQVQANTFASMLFLNRSNRFDAVPLPDQAQWSPVFGLNVADFDGDGHEDLFLAENFFSQRPEEPRADAGRGLLLRGDGKGGFTAMAGQDSGVKIYGEQRGSAAGDFDADGRVDLLVSQAGAETKLLRNETAKPGLRVRLQGPAGNPRGIGAVVWLLFGTKSGAARELHGGSGYWSQDSAVLVLATPQPPTGLSVRWPGGKLTTVELPAGAAEVSVGLEGKVQKLR
jgi:hypothetical protein